MRILDRYIISSIVSIFIGSVFIFCGMYILIDITTNLDDFVLLKVPMKIVVQYYLYFFPVILTQTSSFACLIAVLFTFSNLNHSNEIIALRSSGLSFWQITRSALMFGLIVSALVFLLNERFVPAANDSSKEIKIEYMSIQVDKMKRKNKITNLTFYGIGNRLFHIDTFYPKTGELEYITITQYDENQKLKEKIVAYKGKWTGVVWKFFQCQVTLYGPGGLTDPINFRVYNEKLIDIEETPDDILRQSVNVSSMNIRELAKYIGRFEHSGAVRALHSLRVDLHQKIAYPFGNFVIVLIGLPFALMLKNRKGMTFTSIGIAIMIGFFYYVANAVFLALGKGGLFIPILSAWAVPLIFIAIALIVIKFNF